MHFNGQNIASLILSEHGFTLHVIALHNACACTLFTVNRLFRYVLVGICNNIWLIYCYSMFGWG